jgi:hypothetical protein
VHSGGSRAPSDGLERNSNPQARSKKWLFRSICGRFPGVCIEKQYQRSAQAFGVKRCPRRFASAGSLVTKSFSSDSATMFCVCGDNAISRTFHCWFSRCIATCCGQFVASISFRNRLSINYSRSVSRTYDGWRFPEDQRPPPKQPIPETLDWILWQGPVPARDYGAVA